MHVSIICLQYFVARVTVKCQTEKKKNRIIYNNTFPSCICYFKSSSRIAQSAMDSYEIKLNTQSSKAVAKCSYILP